MSSIFSEINNTIEDLNNLFNPSRKHFKPKEIFGDFKNLIEIKINKEKLYKPENNTINTTSLKKRKIMEIESKETEDKSRNSKSKKKKRKRKRNRNRRNKNIRGRKKNKNTRKKI